MLAATSLGAAGGRGGDEGGSCAESWDGMGPRRVAARSAQLSRAGTSQVTLGRVRKQHCRNTRSDSGADDRKDTCSRRAEGVRLFREQARAQRGVEAASDEALRLAGGAARQSVGQQAGADAQVTLRLGCCVLCKAALEALGQEVAMATATATAAVDEEGKQEFGIRAAGAAMYLTGRRGPASARNPTSQRLAGLGCYREARRVETSVVCSGVSWAAMEPSAAALRQLRVTGRRAPVSGFVGTRPPSACGYRTILSPWDRRRPRPSHCPHRLPPARTGDPERRLCTSRPPLAPLRIWARLHAANGDRAAESAKHLSWPLPISSHIGLLQRAAMHPRPARRQTLRPASGTKHASWHRDAATLHCSHHAVPKLGQQKLL
ncbi:hypothetical protein PSPO01_01613 [Paraphaeosphaeria sporulosa]